MRTEELDREQILDRVADFHGHLGPYVLFGFRAGQLGLRELGAKGYFDLEAVVYCGAAPPVSCFADGVQLGSGCTTGKGNLVVTAGRPVAAGAQPGGPPRGGPEATVLFRFRPADGPVGTGGSPRSAEGRPPRDDGGRSASVLVSVRPDVAAAAGKWLADLGDRGAAYRLLDLSDEEMFQVDRPVRSGAR